MILFRLTIDISLMKDTIVCSEVERAITTVLKAIPEDGTDDTVSYPKAVMGLYPNERWSDKSYLHIPL